MKTAYPKDTATQSITSVTAFDGFYISVKDIGVSTTGDCTVTGDAITDSSVELIGIV